MFWQPAATMAAAAIEKKARFETRVVLIELHPIVVGARGAAAHASIKGNHIGNAAARGFRT